MKFNNCKWAIGAVFAQAATCERAAAPPDAAVQNLSKGV